MTLRCLREQYKEKGDCREYGQNVRNCRKFWVSKIRDLITKVHKLQRCIFIVKFAKGIKGIGYRPGIVIQ